jgi:hypothetical protein
MRARALAVVLSAMLCAAAVGGWTARETAAQDSSATFTPVLHSVSYLGIWRGQAQLTVDQFLVKAKELGFSHVEMVAKKPHASPLDYDADARRLRPSPVLHAWPARWRGHRAAGNPLRNVLHHRAVHPVCGGCSGRVARGLPKDAPNRRRIH